MAHRSHLRQPSTASARPRARATHREPSFPVLFVTPQGVQQLTFEEGARATITVVRGQLVLQLGEEK